MIHTSLVGNIFDFAIQQPFNPNVGGMDYQETMNNIIKVGGGVAGVLQMFSGRSWHTLQANGTYKKIKNLEYLTFPCVKK